MIPRSPYSVTRGRDEVDGGSHKTLPIAEIEENNRDMCNKFKTNVNIGIIFNVLSILSCDEN